MAKRVFLIVLDSFGVGAEPDAPLFGDVGTNTLGAIAGHPNFRGDNLARLGMFNLDGVTCGTPAAAPIGSYARLREASAGKDTTIGHWEIAGLLSAEPLPTFPDGFPQELLDAFTAKTGYKVLCNKPYSGTDVIRDYGEEHMKTGALIVYTSADSVFQIAANEAIVPVEKLYEICAQARELLTGKYGVGRVIARPFVGDCAANFTRTPRRHDYSLVPPHDTMLDAIQAAGKSDHRCRQDPRHLCRARASARPSAPPATPRVCRSRWSWPTAILRVWPSSTSSTLTCSTATAATLRAMPPPLPSSTTGCPRFMAKMRPGDILMVTADHGCDPSYTKTTDHTREHVPFLIYGRRGQARRQPAHPLQLRHDCRHCLQGAGR